MMQLMQLRSLCGGDKRVPERVRADGLADPGTAGDPADDPPGAMPIQSPPVTGEEDRPVTTLADGQVDRPGGARCERDGDDLPALAGNGQGPVPAFQAQVLEIGDASSSRARLTVSLIPGRRQVVPASSRDQTV